MDSAGNELKWDWLPCNYNLKREIDGKQVIQNLSPSIILTNPISDGPDPNVKLFIDTEKQLQYTNELGWNWHKSWNLPNISVRLEIKDSKNGELLLSPKNLYANLFAVKAVLDQNDNFHLVEVGLRGVNKIELIDGHAFFSALKFSSTSYNNEGVKFHLVLSLYILNEDDDIPKVLNSTISPPIFVDSRKSARDSHLLMEKKLSSFVEPFHPENLDKMFIKRENKKKNDVEIQILNEFEGLFNYLTAPNIRHKVKHPLFLCIKFSKCVKLYFNTNQIDMSNGMETFITKLQKQIVEEHQQNKKTSQPSVSGQNSDGNSKVNDKIYLLVIDEANDTFKNKKISEAVDPLSSTSLGVVYSLNQQIPSHFEEITEINELMSTYKLIYPNLISQSKVQKSQHDKKHDKRDQSDNDSEAESEVSNPNPTKKVKSQSDFKNLMGQESQKQQQQQTKLEYQQQNFASNQNMKESDGLNGNGNHENGNEDNIYKKQIQKQQQQQQQQLQQQQQQQQQFIQQNFDTLQQQQLLQNLQQGLFFPTQNMVQNPQQTQLFQQFLKMQQQQQQLNNQQVPDLQQTQQNASLSNSTISPLFQQLQKQLQQQNILQQNPLQQPPNLSTQPMQTLLMQQLLQSQNLQQPISTPLQGQKDLNILKNLLQGSAGNVGLQQNQMNNLIQSQLLLQQHNNGGNNNQNIQWAQLLNQQGLFQQLQQQQLQQNPQQQQQQQQQIELLSENQEKHINNNKEIIKQEEEHKQNQ